MGIKGTEERKRDASYLEISNWKGEQRRLTAWIKGVSEKEIEVEDLRGTFADNMKAPIHRWFRYSTGFSYSLVEECFRLYQVRSNDLVLDPFVGCGTTSVCAKKWGINSKGVEAHPFVVWVAKVKTYWDFDLHSLKREINDLLSELKNKLRDLDVEKYELNKKPKLLLKSFSREKLAQLYAAKEVIDQRPDEHFRDLCILGLTTVLRKVSKAHTGWPYILPKKVREETKIPDVYEAFKDQLAIMYDDLQTAVRTAKKKCETEIFEADARNMKSFINDEEVDFAFTSPPYLNNYDYADRTRLELYFLGQARTWNDITVQIRNKLIVSATTQVNGLNLHEGLMPKEDIVLDVREYLIRSSEELRKQKRVHGGHKDYDIMSVAYFNDMYSTMEEVYRVLKPGKYYLLILGDSAPYGVHIPTDVFLAKLGLGVGFSKAKIRILRKRGGKWKSAPKHRVPLRESLVILQK